MSIVRKDTGKGHSYWNTETGQRIPGVTTIIDKSLRKQAIENWSATTTADYAIDHWDELTTMAPSARLKLLNRARYLEKDTAANRGTQVHKLAERLVKGERVGIPDGLDGYVQSYVKFLDEFNVDPIEVEGLVWSEEHNYCGTFDLVADLTNPDTGELDTWLVDLKTNRSGIFRETALQVAAYRYADLIVDGEPHPMPEIARTGAVWIRPDGYSLIPVAADEWAYRKFLYAAQIPEFMDAELVGEPVEPPSESRWQLTQVDADEVLF